MARPKKGTPEGDIALEKWKQTMINKYGENYKDIMKVIGAKGGKNGRGPNYTGGFAGRPDIASSAGAKGGKKSRRGGSYNKLWEQKKDEALNLHFQGKSYADISRLVGIPYSTLLNKIRKELRNENL